MIRWNGISSSCQRFLCFLAVMAIAGCDKGSPQADSAHANATAGGVALSDEPTSAELLKEVPEPVAEVAPQAIAPAAESPESEPRASDKKAPSPPPVDPTPAPLPPTTKKQPKVALSVPEPPEYVYEPEVLMAQRDADTCLVKVGDSFPLGQLSDLQGDPHALKELLGEKLTVVVLWSNANRLGREQIQRLEAETILPFEHAGVSVVAINTGDSAEQITELLTADRKFDFTMLLDTDAAFFATVATQRQPRTYLLDATGKILWFDIEYSRGAARDLVNAIHVYLGDRKPGDS